MNLELLNAAKDFIVEDANRQGISLAQVFGTPENFRQAVISMVIKTAMEVLDCDVRTAHDLVLGEGSYQELLDACWAELNA